SIFFAVLQKAKHSSTHSTPNIHLPAYTSSSLGKKDGILGKEGHLQTYWISQQSDDASFTNYRCFTTTGRRGRGGWSSESSGCC
ncbi:hypothetical protein LINPERHAP1_LOCUS17894, partial [Linum perenne]